MNDLNGVLLSSETTQGSAFSSPGFQSRWYSQHPVSLFDIAGRYRSFNTHHKALVEYHYGIHVQAGMLPDVFMQSSRYYHRLVANRNRAVSGEFFTDRIAFDSNVVMDFYYSPLLDITGTVVGHALAIIDIAKQRDEQKANLQVELHQERNRIAGELHDELGATLSKISALCQVIIPSEHLADPVRHVLDRVLHLSAEAQNQLGEIIWSMNPEYDTLESLASYLRFHAGGYLECTECRLEMELELTQPDLPISGRTRRHLFLIVKEAMNNVFKHASATKVELRLVQTDRSLQLVIRDNGKGIGTNGTPPFRQGMKSMRFRASDLGGLFEVVSTPGSGTTVRVSVPL